MQLSCECHEIFASHTHYNSQIWGLSDNTVTLRILKLQNLAMTRITFNGLRISAANLYAELGILKFFHQVKVMSILYA